MPFGVGSLFGILAGGAWLLKESVVGMCNHADCQSETKWLDKHTNVELENKLWRDVHDPSKYNEIWERIENYKKNGGYYSITHPYCKAWERVGVKGRLEFFNKKGEATNPYQGNREVAHNLLVQTYDILTFFRASCNSPYQLRREAKAEKKRYW